eukprot:TRINITY_DN2069_c0_g1_i3.p1 TRINITY_DN2069_c0_g1~~TRINITY_DN2069_c0_g1_i3.p1  ORF type:complete len:198 (+),score=59.82 TRINITY_DN2069_c0_g1_i3:148-741(+)
MAVAYDGGVVMGADSRTSTGTYIANRVSDKITPITDKIYCCRSGSAADTQAIVGYTKWYLEMHSVELNEPPQVRTAASMAHRIVYGNKEQLLAGLIVAGYDSVEKGSVYTITVGGAKVKQPFAIGGSGSTYIYGYCDSQYKPNMTKAECQEFVKNALALAMARDGSSGGVIRLATIDASGVERTMIPGDQLPKFFEG